MSEINPLELSRVIQAILKAQNHLQWKPAKAYPHLMKRIRLGHLPENATIETYLNSARRLPLKFSTKKIIQNLTGDELRKNTQRTIVA